MNFLQHHFALSGVETTLWLPPLVAFLVSTLTSTGGISGAFLILPFQISILGFTGPGVTATNFLYNLVGTPGGVYRYAREKRMLWPLAASLIAGTLPGVLLGYVVRVRFLPDPRAFKLFVGIVLLCIGMRLVVAAGARGSSSRPATGRPTFRIERVTGHMRAVAVHFDDTTVRFNPVAVFLLGLSVGVIGGIYGIGGGAILAPVLITFFVLPVHIIAGAVLAVNFMTSLAGVMVYSSVPMLDGQASPPDWQLGALLGIGGLCGMYAGARLQRFLPELLIKTVLAGIALVVSSKYIIQYF
jgi:uncharacterized membrane protein YfcA